MSCLSVQRQIELEYIHMRFADKAQHPAFNVHFYQMANIRRRHIARLGYPRHLEESSGRGDVGIKAACGACDQIDGHRCSRVLGLFRLTH